MWSLFVVKCLQKYYSRWSGSWSTLDWLFKIQNRSSIDKHDTIWATGHSAPGDCQTCKNCTFWISTQHYCKWNAYFKYVLSKSECQIQCMNPMIALGQRMLYISCTSSIPPIWSEIYLRLSPARSLDVRLTHPCIHFPFVLSLTKYNSTEACAIYQVQSPFNPALSGHGQIAPPLLMLLFLACRHNWNKVLPPSTSDGWECCLLSMLPFKQNHCGLFFIQIAI